jgi:hypothetical protein
MIEVELGRKLHRKIAGLSTLQYFVHISDRAAPVLTEVDPAADQTARLNLLT